MLSPSNETYMSSFEFESRSYDPYLIAYHEDTNTFTYNDPWEVVSEAVVSNESCSNDNEINCDLDEDAKTFEIIGAYASVPNETETPPQPIDRHDTIEHERETAEFTPPSVPEVTVEHVQEVSFPRTSREKSSTRQRKNSERKFSNKFSPFHSRSPVEGT